ncbi:hypothetical protein BJY01DRAFT_83820 [Aspergillus pseudoustus]|uniref:BZIP domain-containing protein n=1 Tax=Aspergillus pseudoustus TaxID=1810923 RepID=A0ABR4J3M0_9EURO
MSDVEPPLPRNGSRVRRRPPRKVSSLTAQQVQHKRDLDRKAQRALRQRVKSRMQDLEDDLTRAKSDCSVREQKMMEEIQLLREENRKLRSYLDSIGQFAINGAAGENGALIDDAATPDPMPPVDDDEPPLENEDSHEPLPYDRALPNQPTVPDRAANQTQGDGIEGHQLSWIRDPLDGPDTPRGQPNTSVPPTYHNANTSLAQIDLPSPATEGSLSRVQTRHFMETPGPRDRHMDELPHALPESINAPSHSMLTPTWAAPLHPTFYQPSLSTGIASVLPKHTAATCPLDQILLDFILARRSMLAKGYSMDLVLGSPHPSLQAILYPGPPTPEVHDTSRVLGEVLTTFAHVALPEKLGFMFVMYRTMRWQISPTDATYEEMPRWLRPTATQITVPHAAWIDNIPWPRVRDLLIENPTKHPFALFSELYSQNISINWPYDKMDCVSTQGDNVQLNPIFEKHIRNLNNWTVAKPFQEYLPDMAAAIYGKD